MRDTSATDAAKEMLKEHNIDNTIRDRREHELGLPQRPAAYGATYLEHGWEINEIAGVDNPTSLNDKAWETISRANSIFHGFVISHNGALIRARRPAFELKPIPGQTGTDAIKYIPDFEVFDNSSISIKETESELARSMAQNGFSSLAIEASVSGGFGGYSAAASAGFSQESAKSTSKGDFANRKEYTATYSVSHSSNFFLYSADLQ